MKAQLNHLNEIQSQVKLKHCASKGNYDRTGKELWKPNDRVSKIEILYDMHR